MARDYPPLLEGSRLAWLLASASATVVLVLVLDRGLTPWLGALLHVALLSVAAFALFVWDKHRARKDARRISEANLLWLAVLGGAAGAWLGMRRIRHKTQHARFRMLVPAALLLHVGAIVWLALRGHASA